MDTGTINLLLWIILFKGVVGPLTDAGQREKEYVLKISTSLDQTILKKFIRLPDLENEYKSRRLATRILNITDIVLSKAAILERIFREKEGIVKRVAEEAERLRNRAYPEDSSVLKKKLTYYYESIPVNGTPTLDPGKMPYHFARCNCEENLDGIVEPSQCLQQQTDYSTNTHFGNEKVSFLNTSVHLPIDVYEGDQFVLRDLYLSDGIDDAVKQEVCTESEFSHLTKWVYFTTETGVMRFFPDRVWTTNCRQADALYDSGKLYDGRTAPWYINSMTSPKDVIILIDSSGSVKGPTYTALVWSIKELMKTLTPNDFMNMVLFNKDVELINSCEGLFQATPRNKQLVLDLLESAEFRYEAVYEPAFQKVFAMLHSASDHATSVTARCNPSVILFTDGDSSLPTEAMSRWNSLKQFRVFSFAIGETTFPKDGTKQIACENRGFYDTIPFFEARQRARNYLKKLSEPMSAQAQKHPQWTLSYQDRLGLGEVVSVSVPVYHRDGNLNSSTGDSYPVIGAVGTDLSLVDLKKIIYDDDMTNDYYTFLLDNNGFSIVHPLLKKNIHDDVSAVDFVELEGGNVLKVREDIINGNTGSATSQKGVFFDDKYYHESTYTYAFTEVKNTVFKMGVGIHQSKLKYIDSYHALKESFPPSLSLRTLTNDNDPGSNSDALLYSSPCVTSTIGGYNPCTVNKTTSANCPECFTEGVLLSELDESNCDNTSYLYSNLLLHGYLSDEFSMDKWEASNSQVEDGDGALALFIAIDSPSFVRITYLNFSKQIGGSYSQYDDIIKNDIKTMLADPRNSTYFRRAALKPNLTMYSYVTGSELTTVESVYTTVQTETTTFYDKTTASFVDVTKESSLGYILAAKSVQVVENDDKMVSVVTGVILDSEAFQRNLVGLDWVCDEENGCQNIDLLCRNNKEVECLVLDDGGHLISSNLDQHSSKLGQFLGLVEGDLMAKLVELDVYKKFAMTDYQSYCPKTAQGKSAGIATSYVPSIMDVLSFGWWLSSNVKIFLYLIFRSVLFGLGSVLNIGHPHVLVSATGTNQDKMELCVLSHPVVQFGYNGQSSVYGEYECPGGCESGFFAVRDTKTNLLFVFLRLSDDTCYDACHSTPSYTLSSTDVTLAKMCSNDTVRYRKTPGHCYDSKTFDEAYDSPCSASFPLLPSYYHIFLLFLLVNLIMNRFIG